MIWFWLFQSLSLVAFIAVVYGAFKLRRDKLDNLEEWLIKHWRKVLIGWGITFLVMVLVMCKPLWLTVTCQFDGWSMNTETSYSWYKGQCLMKTKTGAWLPININRDQPQGDHVIID